MDALKPSPFSEALRHLDNLIDEARELHERITAAIRREREPFFPDRRRQYRPHKPERRKR